ncbi:Putative zinc ribbon domain-containing protein [Paenibacillus tianmuensis]|uniref:Putative zinc ribbon domain-containing protein n=1 Tax=Paenibacillus tianmuensis TaxID=624147 RepID=A0A1G4RGW5_9BACL|nr:zinc ribbon domain-containing protein [Paenibacillus tianmuensis]SCW56094.1 Putative zinc ribbon domain-containing protein [Paenibacillus tianmuensis]
MDKQFCQSCSMPLNTAEDFGTNADGSRNEEYCTYCYQGGAFTSPDATVQSMIEECVPHVVEGQGISEQQAREMLNQVIPSLKRWA